MAPENSTHRKGGHCLQGLFNDLLATDDDVNLPILNLSANTSTPISDSQTFLTQLRIREKVNESEWADQLRERLTVTLPGWITSVQVKELALEAQSLAPEGHDHIWLPACLQIRQAILAEDSGMRLWLTVTANMRNWLDGKSFQSRDGSSRKWPCDEQGNESVAEASRSQWRLHALYQYLRDREGHRN